METATFSEEVFAQIKELVADRDRRENELSTELRYAQSANQELASQNDELCKRLSLALSLIKSLLPNQDLTGEDSLLQEVAGTNCPSSKEPLLQVVDEHLKNGSAQQALIALKPIRANFAQYTTPQRIEAELLQCGILRHAKQLVEARSCAENALRMAQDHGLRDLAGKAQYYRGLCFKDNFQFANAKWCYVLASHQDEVSDVVNVDMQLLDWALKSEPASSPKRFVSLDFNI